MTPFWQAIAFCALWTAVVAGIPAYFATRAVRTGRIYVPGYDGDDTPDQYVYRSVDPERFWSDVAFLYGLALFGLAPWVMILVVGIKE
jgi:hypothetical protein